MQLRVPGTQPRLRALLGCLPQRLVLLESLKWTVEIIENLGWLEFRQGFRVIPLAGSQQVGKNPCTATLGCWKCFRPDTGEGLMSSRSLEVHTQDFWLLVCTRLHGCFLFQIVSLY